MTRTALWRLVGLAAGLVAAAAAASAGALGRGPMLAAPLLGLCVLAGVLGGELSVRRPAGPVRQADLTPRRVVDFLPRRLALAVGLAAAALTVLLTVTTAAGAPDDLGRAGRSLTRTCLPAVGPGNAGMMTTSHGPWPGSYYSVPLALIVLAGLAGALITFRQIVVRPRPGDPAAVGRADDAARRSAARAVTGACGVLVTIPLIGTSLFSAAALLGISCRPAAWSVAGYLILVLIPVWIAVLGFSALAVLGPAGASRRGGAAG